MMMVKAEENKLNRLGGTIANYQHIEDACKQDVCKIKTPLWAATDVVRSATKVYWLSGLTCTDENFSQKAGAFQAACDNQVPVEWWYYTDFYYLSLCMIQIRYSNLNRNLVWLWMELACGKSHVTQVVLVMPDTSPRGDGIPDEES